MAMYKFPEPCHVMAKCERCNGKVFLKDDSVLRAADAILEYRKEKAQREAAASTSAAAKSETGSWLASESAKSAAPGAAAPE